MFIKTVNTETLKTRKGLKIMWLSVGEKCALLVIVLSKLSSLSVTGQWKNDDELWEGDSCTLSNGYKGICTRLVHCTPYIQGITTGTIEYGSLKICCMMDTDEVICCPIQPSVAACENYTKPLSIDSRILGGTVVMDGEFPHMAALLLGDTDTDKLHCGASLISEKYVLTAAHCVIDPIIKPVKVRLGFTYLNAPNTTSGDIEIEKIIIHPMYRQLSRYHDIALIKLKKDATLSATVRPACLHTDVAEIDSNITLWITGWGVMNISTRKTSSYLLKANVSWVPLKTCSEFYNNSGGRLKQGLFQGQCCAYEPNLGNDACALDSGGPLQIKEVSHILSTIVGIVSFGKTCGSSAPGVYTRVAFYLNWIECIVWPKEAATSMINCSMIIERT